MGQPPVHAARRWTRLAPGHWHLKGDTDRWLHGERLWREQHWCSVLTWLSKLHHVALQHLRHTPNSCADHKQATTASVENTQPQGGQACVHGNTAETHDTRHSPCSFHNGNAEGLRQGAV